MAQTFDLVLTADSEALTAELRLLDAAGAQLGYRAVDFKPFPASRLQLLFELRNYLRTYVEPGQEHAEVEKLGVVIAEEVLGAEIFGHLWRPESHRTLRIRLPGAGDEDNPLVAALARLPWEIARPRVESETLFERNLVVRVVHDTAPPASAPLELGLEEPLRVLFVFAEARGSTPLGARRERRALQRLFREEIYPSRRVEAHFLVHGVTRERLEEQIEDHGGYHVVHWSGHGHQNRLELAKPGGTKDSISGERLLDLFQSAGGFLPRFAFLSACHSGGLLRVRDWTSLEAVAQGREPAERSAAETRELDLAEAPGFTGTAHAFLQAGVPAVVAMRDSVGDEYARELAFDFYRSVFAAAKPKTVATALNQARKSLLEGTDARFTAADPATPVLYGAEDAGLPLPPGRSPALDGRQRRLHPIAELTLASHESFVGRTWELDGLGADFLGSKKSPAVKPVAVVTGLGGMGKTALVAEVLDLWESRFDWVATYQAKPNALGFEAFLRDLDLKLRGELGVYQKHVAKHPADAIYRDATVDFTGEERQARLIRNLVRALKDEPILLVLDNFETNLRPTDEKARIDGQPVWKCQDPAWDALLGALATGLAGTGSRVLVTSRRLPAALAGGVAHRVPLGPLPAGEARLFLREHPTLGGMFFGKDAEERKLAERLLAASRFHPLLMDRFAKLTATPELLSQLEQVLVSLESRTGFETLPELFTTERGDLKETAYLEDALVVSIDQLIAGASPEARRLLWMIAVANEPVALGLVRAVWGGESQEQTELRQFKAFLDALPNLPPEVRAQAEAKLPPMPPEFRAVLDALPPAPQVPDIEPFLRHLVGVGLVTEERTGPEDENPDLSCHELVRERALAWGKEKAEELGGKTENSVRLGYAEWLAAFFKALQHRNMTLALQAGSRALVYCVQAEAWDRLGGFASEVVTSSRDPRLLEGLIPHLRTAAEAAAEGQPRWSCLGYLADALDNAGRHDASLPFFEQAAALARVATKAEGEDSRQAWAGLALISGNSAAALFRTGNLQTARERRLEAADAHQNAGHPAIYGIGNELEALRIDIQQGQVAAALPAVEERLERVAGWWRQHRAGQPVPEAPDAEILARVYIGTLDIATDADFALKNWESALVRIEAMLEVRRDLERPAEDFDAMRFNRANVLLRLGRFGEARAELEACLEVFRNDPAASSKVLSSLADLFDKQGDVAQAIQQERRALARCEQLPDPGDRAISHNNLAGYLERQGVPAALDEAPRQQLAALVYRLEAELGQDLKSSLHNYRIAFRRTRAAGTEAVTPRLADLLADPAFDPLRTWLEGRQVDLGELQADIDQFLDQARQAALAEP
jgi:tetratricopeptide (TPR) repeat protein